MRRLLQRVAGDDRGVALVMALMLMLILAGTTAALVIPGAVNQRNSLKSADAKQAFALAETAMAYGQGAVFAGDVALPGTTTPQPVSAPGGGTANWSATFLGGSCNCMWSLTSVGQADGISRSITEVLSKASSTSTADYNVWNYLYADGTGSCTSLSGSVSITVPMLLRGDLCLSGSVGFTGSSLKVGGNLTVSGSATIGAAGSKILTLQVGDKCNSVTPGTGACDGNHSPIYASSVSPTLDVTPQMPCIGQPSTWDPQCKATNTPPDDGNWAELAAAYTTQAGLTKTGCPANLFDNDSTLNNSDASISSVMFGNSDYDCKLGTNEIKWTHSTNSLFVSGTLFFDGSLNLSGTVTYSGQATMYFTGGVSTTGSAKFCGITNCTTFWQPDTNGIVFVAGCWANSTGSSLTTSGCINIGGSSQVQFAAYVTTNYSIAGGASNMGPVLANSLSLGGSTSSLIPFHNMPPGTPKNTDLIPHPAAIDSWSG